MQRQTPGRIHLPDPVRAVLFSAAGASRIRHWHPPTRSDWRCNRTACADNVVSMRTSKDGNAIQPIDAHVGAVRYHALHFAGSLQLDPDQGQALHVVHACGRGTRLQVPAGWLSLHLPLSGRLQFESAEVYWVLPSGRLQPWRDGPISVSCHAPDLWLALSVPSAVRLAQNRKSVLRGKRLSGRVD